MMPYCHTCGRSREKKRYEIKSDQQRSPSVSSLNTNEKSQCEAQSCCWDQFENMCTCAVGSDNHLRTRRSNHKIHLQWSISDCDCKGYELGTTGKGPRPFRVVCSKVTTNKGNKKKKKECSTTFSNDCQYDGNPHHCPEYKNNENKFYSELLATIGPFQCDQIDVLIMPEKNKNRCPTGNFQTKKTCKDYPYHRD